MEDRCNKSLSMVIPAYNEGTIVYGQVKFCIEQLMKDFQEFEVILVDDGCIDNTGAEMDRLAQEFSEVKVIHNYINLNMGISVQRGMAIARNDYITFSAVDFPFAPEQFKGLIEGMGGEDVLVVQRDEYLGTSVWRRCTSLINRGMMLFLFPKAKRGIKDTNYFQVYRKAVIKELLPLAKSPIFTWPEMIFRARRKGFEVKVVMVEYNPKVVRKGAFGKPNDILWGIYDMLRYRIWSILNK